MTTNYSCTTFNPGIDPPLFETLGFGTTSATLEYNDPSSASLILYEQGPNDLNMSATSVALNTSAGVHTVSVGDLTEGDTFFVGGKVNDDVIAGLCLPGL